MSNIKDYIREVLSGRLDSDGSININLAEYNRLHKYFPRECLEVQTELVTGCKVIEKGRCDRCAFHFLKSSDGDTRCKRCTIKYPPYKRSKKKDLPPPEPAKTPIRGFGHICLECDEDLKYSWWSGKLLGCKNRSCIQYWRRK